MGKIYSPSVPHGNNETPDCIESGVSFRSDQDGAATRGG